MLPVAAFYQSKASKLGQDPLREDADPEEAWRRVSVSRKPVGCVSNGVSNDE